MRRLTSSISAINEDDDYNYFIETTQNMPFPSKPPKLNKKIFLATDISNDYSNPNTNPNYIAQLEKKVSIQSKKICELQNYKSICEEFIKKLNPYQTFPITEEMLSKEYEIVKDPINAAEQQNYTDLLKKTIENELIKNGLLNNNINAEGVIDLAKIRLESEEYKKQLVLAQSMINSLKNDLVELTKENKEYKMNEEKNINLKNNESINMNNQIFDINNKLMSYKNNYEKISKDFEKLLDEKKNIKNENSILKNEINEYKSKIEDLEKEINEIKNNNINNGNVDKSESKKNKYKDYMKQYDEVIEEITKKDSKSTSPTKDNRDKLNSNNEHYIKTLNENKRLTIENQKLKEDIKKVINEKNEIGKQNENNKNKIIQLSKKLEKEKEEHQKEVNKLKEKYIEKENENENYNYYIDDTEDDNFFDNKKDSKNENENEKENYVLKQNKSKSRNLNSNIIKTITNTYLQEKYNELNDKYVQLNANYNDMLIKYAKIQNEKEKIKDMFNKISDKNNDKYKLEDNNKNEIKKLIEQSLELNKKNNDDDSFNYNKINYKLWEMDNEIKEKEKKIVDLKAQKEQFENEILQKFKYYDDYITNNKLNIKSLLSSLLNLLIQFKERVNYISQERNNNNLDEFISPQFISDTDKLISQINTINNITNYDIELNDSIFFETINNFISMLYQELSMIFNVNERGPFYNSKKEETKNNEELFSKINFLNNDRNELMKNYSEIKKKNYNIVKENTILKNEILDLDNKLKEIKLKYNCNQKTILVNNEGKKLLLTAMNKFIKNISYDNELSKLMYDILNIIDQINLINLNKCLVEEKLNLMKNNGGIEGEPGGELGIFLMNEKNKLEKLIDDYNRKINQKKGILQKLNDDYDLKENLYSNNIKELKEKNEFLMNDNEEMRNKIISMEKEKYNLNEFDKEHSEKDTYQNSASKIYNKTLELFDKNKKINYNLDLFTHISNSEE